VPTDLRVQADTVTSAHRSSDSPCGYHCTAPRAGFNSLPVLRLAGAASTAGHAGLTGEQVQNGNAALMRMFDRAIRWSRGDSYDRPATGEEILPGYAPFTASEAHAWLIGSW
jgi:hypothetical protein